MQQQDLLHESYFSLLAVYSSAFGYTCDGKPCSETLVLHKYSVVFLSSFADKSKVPVRCNMFYIEYGVYCI